jgi:hypothetical protein
VAAEQTLAHLVAAGRKLEQLVREVAAGRKLARQLPGGRAGCWTKLAQVVGGALHWRAHLERPLSGSLHEKAARGSGAYACGACASKHRGGMVSEASTQVTGPETQEQRRQCQRRKERGVTVPEKQAERRDSPERPEQRWQRQRSKQRGVTAPERPEQSRQVQRSKQRGVTVPERPEQSRQVQRSKDKDMTAKNTFVLESQSSRHFPHGWDRALESEDGVRAGQGAGQMHSRAQINVWGKGGVREGEQVQVVDTSKCKQTGTNKGRKIWGIARKDPHQDQKKFRQHMYISTLKTKGFDSGLNFSKDRSL